MRLVILGPPGSGKGTQAAMLVEHLGVPHISTGALLREAINAGSELGAKAKSTIEKGELVPDDVMLGIVEQRDLLHAMHHTGKADGEVVP